MGPALLLLMLQQAPALDPSIRYTLPAPTLGEAVRRTVRPCRSPSADEVVICADRDRQEANRLPIRPDGFDPAGTVESVSRERHRRFLDHGASGTQSCSPVGSGGWTGCMTRSFRAREQQSPGSGLLRF